MPKIPKYRQSNAYFEYHNENPKGRKGVGDCVFRAIAFGTQKPWTDVVREMSEIAIEIYDAPNGDMCIERFFANHGIPKRPQPKKDNGCKYTVKEFIQEFTNSKSRYVVSVANHLTAVFMGKVYDTWDCSDKTVCNYWIIDEDKIEKPVQVKKTRTVVKREPDYEKVFDKWCQLTEYQDGRWKIIDKDKHLIQSTYDTDLIETMDIKDMVDDIKEKLSHYYDSDFDVYELKETDPTEWRSQTMRLRNFIIRYGK